MAIDESYEIQLDEFDTENDLPAFLFLMLDKLEKNVLTVRQQIQVIYKLSLELWIKLVTF